MTQLQLFSEPEIIAMDTASVFDDEDEMRILAPSLFATKAHPKMSQRYVFTNTYDVVKKMHDKGFKVTSVMGGRDAYAKVMVRMRMPGYDKRDNVPELGVLDSHDGSRRLKLFLGIMRLVCMNGCVAGDMLYSKSFLHLIPDLMEQVLLELEDIQEHIDKLTKRVDVMKAYKTNVGERILLANEAIKVRFGEERDASFITDMRRNMLQRRRSDDEADDMYTVMNVIQENILRGGMMYHTPRRVLRVSPINSVDRNMNINQVLWQTAENLINVQSPALQPN